LFAASRDPSQRRRFTDLLAAQAFYSFVRVERDLIHRFFAVVALLANSRSLLASFDGRFLLLNNNPTTTMELRIASLV